ncbi:hypothetical protein QBC43DRAFT_339716 [Cladorrhinum sp. PSN259]|nr:hypothetical protein QBC43DRAFT_339716 [Cladorrhinum sp. PSN259]
MAVAGAMISGTKKNKETTSEYGTDHKEEEGRRELFIVNLPRRSASRLSLIGFETAVGRLCAVSRGASSPDTTLALVLWAQPWFRVQVDEGIPRRQELPGHTHTHTQAMPWISASSKCWPSSTSAGKVMDIMVDGWLASLVAVTSFVTVNSFAYNAYLC